MIDVNLINDFVISLGSFLSALTVVAGVIYQVMWKPYTKRKEEREEKYQKNMLEIAEKQTEPISEIIKDMNESFKEHNRHADERDRLIAQNAEIIKQHEERFKEHDDRLDSHNNRLIVLEVKNGVRKVTYQEGNEE